MARETKVGLLAGLAFIICFAVILANRGVNGPPGLSNTFLPNGGLELPKLVQRNQATGDAVANAAHNRNRPLVRQPASEPSVHPTANAASRPQAPQAVVDNAVPATGAQLPLTPNVELVRPNPESSLAQNTRPVDVPAPANVGLERAMNSPVQMIATNPQPTEPVAGSGRIGISESPVVPATESSNSLPPVQASPYTVKASDTLSSIASAHYGTKSKHAVEVIFDANRSVLSDINNVKPGMVLMIPKGSSPVSGKGQPAPKVALVSEKVVESKGKGSERSAPEKKSAEKDKDTAKKATETVAESDRNSRNFKWYQVKKNDRFASIAREQLGDAGRWQEVYELNKDKFPDPQHIREGVRIKLPTSVALADAGREKKR